MLSCWGGPNVWALFLGRICDDLGGEGAKCLGLFLTGAISETSCPRMRVSRIQDTARSFFGLDPRLRGGRYKVMTGLF